MKYLRWRNVLMAAVALLLLVWIGGELAYPRTNPPERYTGTILSAQSDAILARACFDCHSNETRHPWYTHLPGMGLVIGNHIREGRQELNFSTWARMDAGQRAEAIEESVESLREGEMPAFGYTFLHPDAELTAADISTLAQDAAPYLSMSGEGGERERGEHVERDDDDEDEDEEHERD